MLVVTLLLVAVSVVTAVVVNFLVYAPGSITYYGVFHYQSFSSPPTLLLRVHIDQLCSVRCTDRTENCCHEATKYGNDG